MSEKTYTLVRQKHLNKFSVIDKFTIKCLGGEKMPKEKDELVFLDSPVKIPKSKGKTGRNWVELFDKIPEGQVLVMTKKQFGSAPNIRVQVADYNKRNGEVLKSTQRTEGEETTLYVTRIKKEE